MLNLPDRDAVLRWCRARRVNWSAEAGQGRDAIRIAADCGPMTLRAAPEGWLLEAESGEVLAASSDLPALLDAVDAGIATVPIVAVEAVAAG